MNIKDKGFESLEELSRMVAAVDLSTPEKIIAFRLWKNYDGSKEGLMDLLEVEDDE
jgi:hypothetical protein